MMPRTVAFALALKRCGLTVREIATAMSWTIDETRFALRRYG